MRARPLALLLLAFLSACNYLPSWMGGEKPQGPRLPGERAAVMTQGEELKPDAALAKAPMALPAPTPNASWPQHTGFIAAANGNLAAGGNFNVIAHADIAGGEAFTSALVPRPVVAENMVFAMDAAGKISAHDAANVETVLWQSPGVVEEDEPEVFGGGLAYDQGVLYALSGRGAAAALDAKTGAVRWRKSILIPFRSAPKVDRGKLYALTIDNQLFALSAATGDVLWSHRGIDEITGLMNSVTPAASGDVVIAPYSSGELYALAAADGREVWRSSLALPARTYATSAFSGIGGDPVIDGAVVFAASSGGLFSVSSVAAGQPAWSRPISSVNTPWIAGDYVFLLTADNVLVAFVKYDGRIRWSSPLPSYEDMEKKKTPIVWHGPVLVGGQLIVAGAHGQMLMVNAMDGTITETKSIPDRIAAAPIVAGGRMYLVGQDAELYELQ